MNLLQVMCLEKLWKCPDFLQILCPDFFFNSGSPACNIIIIHHHVMSLLWELEQWPVSANSNKWCHRWTIKHWSLNKTVGVMFIKLWYNIYYYYQQLYCWKNIGNFPENYCRKISGKIFPPHITKLSMNIYGNIMQNVQPLWSSWTSLDHYAGILLYFLHKMTDLC